MSEGELKIEDVVDVKEREQSSESIQKLRRDFFKDVRGMKEQIKDSIKETDPWMERELKKNEWMKIKSMLDFLVNRRLRKVALAAVHAAAGAKNVKTHNMTSKEKKLFEDMKELLSEARKEMIHGEYRREVPKKEEPAVEEQASAEEIEMPPKEEHEEGLSAPTERDEKEGEVLIHITDDIPPFVDLDSRTYTLQKEDVVTLREDVASLLISRGKARKIELD